MRTIKLRGQLAAVWEAMAHVGGPCTSLVLVRICSVSLGVRMTDASATARLRDLRKERYGGHEVHITRDPENGLRRYYVIPNPAVEVETYFVKDPR